MPLEMLRDSYKTLNPANAEQAATMFYILTGGGSRRAPVATPNGRK
jgi:hypothetical protein